MGECKERVVRTNTTTVAVLDDFWADFDAVKEQFSKLPVAPASYFDKDMEFYRSAWISTIKGQSLPFYDELNRKILRIYAGETPFFDNSDHEVTLNWNRVTGDRIEKDFFNPHPDPARYTTIVFMNDEYDDGDGFNLYHPVPEPGSPRPFWFGREYVNVDCFVRGKRNRAVIFPGHIYHGLEIRSQRFRDEFRCTAAIFHGKL